MRVPVNIQTPEAIVEAAWVRVDDSGEINAAPWLMRFRNKDGSFSKILRTWKRGVRVDFTPEQELEVLRAALPCFENEALHYDSMARAERNRAVRVRKLISEREPA
jgi:hypothetical protein